MDARTKLLRWVARLVCSLLAVCTSPISVCCSQTLEFPAEEWSRVSPQELGWETTALDSALQFALSRQSSSIVIIKSGRLVAERHVKLTKPTLRYALMKPSETSQGQVIEDVASAQKSVVSLLLGIALDKGLVQLDDAASKYLGTGWSKATPDAEQQITLRNLVTMTSGLNEQLEPVAQPGEQWLYNTSAYSQTLAALESASAMTANELTAKWLLEPIGMRDSKWVERAKLRGVEGGANRYGFSTSAYDLARFGLLMLAHGKWQDQQIVSAEYVRESTSPSQKLNLSYGYLWWLNGQNEIVRGKRTLPGQLNSSAPADMFAAMGALGRKCYVVPSQQLVVVRLGDDPATPAQPDFDREFWRLLMLALPK